MLHGEIGNLHELCAIIIHALHIRKLKHREVQSLSEVPWLIYVKPELGPSPHTKSELITSKLIPTYFNANKINSNHLNKYYAMSIINTVSNDFLRKDVQEMNFEQIQYLSPAYAVSLFSVSVTHGQTHFEYIK